MTAEQANRNALENALRRAEVALEPFVAYWEHRQQFPFSEPLLAVSLPGETTRTIMQADFGQARSALEEIRRLKR